MKLFSLQSKLDGINSIATRKQPRNVLESKSILKKRGIENCYNYNDEDLTDDKIANIVNKSFNYSSSIFHWNS